MPDLSIERWPKAEATPEGGWWGVLDRCDDDAGPYPPVALFRLRGDADAYLNVRDLDGDPLVYDATVTPVLVTADGGIVVGNDYGIETHEQLRAAVVLAPPTEPAGVGERDAVAGPRALLAAYDAAVRTGYPTAPREAEMPKALRATLAEVDRLAGEVAKLTGALRLARDVYAAQKGRIEGERDRLAAALAREEHSHGQTIDARDRASKAADALACAIGTEEEIGEHTNLNDPWANALELLEIHDKQAATLTASLTDTTRERDRVRAALYAVSPRRQGLSDTVPALDRIEAAILALLEPKT